MSALATVQPTEFRTAPATRLGPVHLDVADLAREVTFYRDVLGFRLHRQAGTEAALGAGGEDLLRLSALPQAHPDIRLARRRTGLYHFALLVPARRDLAQLLRRIAVTRTPVHGMVNHHTHLAIYLPDPEGNGIELAWDFPRERWPRLQDVLRLGNAPLEPEDLLADLADDDAPWDGLDDGSRIGHVHLHVADLDASLAFYHGVLGFDTTMLAPEHGAIFVSAGGYHHHIGFNVWNGVGAPPPPPGATGLRHFTIVLPARAELDRVLARVRGARLAIEPLASGALVRDPSGNGVVLQGGAMPG